MYLNMNDVKEALKSKSVDDIVKEMTDELNKASEDVKAEQKKAENIECTREVLVEAFCDYLSSLGHEVDEKTEKAISNGLKNMEKNTTRLNRGYRTADLFSFFFL